MNIKTHSGLKVFAHKKAGPTDSFAQPYQLLTQTRGTGIQAIILKDGKLFPASLFVSLAQLHSLGLTGARTHAVAARAGCKFASHSPHPVVSWVHIVTQSWESGTAWIWICSHMRLSWKMTVHGPYAWARPIMAELNYALSVCPLLAASHQKGKQAENRQMQNGFPGGIFLPQMGKN